MFIYKKDFKINYNWRSLGTGFWSITLFQSIHDDFKSLKLFLRWSSSRRVVDEELFSSGADLVSVSEVEDEAPFEAVGRGRSFEEQRIVWLAFCASNPVWVGDAEELSAFHREPFRTSAVGWAWGLWRQHGPGSCRRLERILFFLLGPHSISGRSCGSSKPMLASRGVVRKFGDLSVQFSQLIHIRHLQKALLCEIWIDKRVVELLAHTTIIGDKVLRPKNIKADMRKILRPTRVLVPKGY